MPTTLHRLRPLDARPIGWLTLIPLVALGLAGQPARGEEPLRLNQVQVIGSHNSYHLAPEPTVLALLRAGGRERADSLDYSHKPLPEQFERLGIRQIELDVFADPEGGKFARPDTPADSPLRQPGLKVLHIPDIDTRTTVPTFAEALAQVRDWSAAHPRHVPILVLVELKDEANAALPTKPVPFDAAGLDAVDAAIRSVFGPGQLLTPDDLRGDFATLPQAIQTRGWPTLDAVRGKVLFALDNEGALRDLYLAGHPALRGRVMFATAPTVDHPAAAWFKLNDPVQLFDGIQDAVRRGFLVRTRADANTVPARRNDPSQRDRALASGAQFVSTDFPEPRPELSPYCVQLPGRVAAHPNPVSAPGLDPARDLEGPLGHAASHP